MIIASLLSPMIHCGSLDVEHGWHGATWWIKFGTKICFPSGTFGRRATPRPRLSSEARAGPFAELEREHSKRCLGHIVAHGMAHEPKSLGFAGLSTG